MKQIDVDVLISIIILCKLLFKILCVVVDDHNKFNFTDVQIALTGICNQCQGIGWDLPLYNFNILIPVFWKVVMTTLYFKFNSKIFIPTTA